MTDAISSSPGEESPVPSFLRREAENSLACDACGGSGRHAHFPGRGCAICGGSGRAEAPS